LVNYFLGHNPYHAILYTHTHTNTCLYQQNLPVQHQIYWIASFLCNTKLLAVEFWIINTEIILSLFSWVEWEGTLPKIKCNDKYYLKNPHEIAIIYVVIYMCINKPWSYWKFSSWFYDFALYSVNGHLHPYFRKAIFENTTDLWHAQFELVLFVLELILCYDFYQKGKLRVSYQQQTRIFPLGGVCHIDRIIL